jgi:hypothetical protein
VVPPDRQPAHSRRGALCLVSLHRESPFPPPAVRAGARCHRPSARSTSNGRERRARGAWRSPSARPSRPRTCSRGGCGSVSRAGVAGARMPRAGSRRCALRNRARLAAPHRRSAKGCPVRVRMSPRSRKASAESRRLEGAPHPSARVQPAPDGSPLGPAWFAGPPPRQELVRRGFAEARRSQASQARSWEERSDAVAGRPGSLLGSLQRIGCASR